MFTIQSTTNDDSQIKTHHASTIEMANAIAANLTERFDCKNSVIESEGAPVYDPGGMMLLDSKLIDIGLIRVAEQHVDHLHAHLTQLLENPPRESWGFSYYKLHGLYAAIIITPNEARFIHTLTH